FERAAPESPFTLINLGDDLKHVREWLPPTHARDPGCVIVRDDLAQIQVLLPSQIEGAEPVLVLVIRYEFRDGKLVTEVPELELTPSGAEWFGTEFATGLQDGLRTHHHAKRIPQIFS